ncbi:hypothetical protein ONE63_010010 [Megalurothrips usitatus]|uniref:Zinc finger CCHC domain-containing protein 4 n=1 Tax=Megalurothrips usitatus TaxID=439358 RepID=A0AAV7XHG9_9NEOP|nr:hypothetical protein ONE63_010010 [Megalurothrips usitatus]
MELSKGVEVILDNLENNPSCPHGPTIIFKRLVDGAEQKFYACSACRDRKDCNFFHNYEDEWTSKKKDSWDMRSKQLLPKIDRDQLIDRFQKVYQLPAADRGYCHTCDSLLLPEERVDHASHDLTKAVTNHQLSHPSEILKPLESAKKEAQYLFARKSTQAIVEMLRSAGIRNVVCVGAPRIHECIRNAYSSDMCSILLDFDHRYHQFYDGSEFAWFNAFNCHWFWGEIGKSATLEFLQKSDCKQLALVTDPPFGGRVEPLAYTFQRIDGFHKELHPNRENPLSLMWIFPYFMEPMILDSCSGMSMLDYKVDYDNHPLFQQGQRGRKYGSPVRIFTNIPLSKLPLPKDEGYRFCDFCEKWVSTENKHCFKCSNCTSKDGRTYVHCDKCARCVKPTWQHCKQCKRCCLPDHKCGEFKPSNCFACHKPGHKKNDCPSRKTLEVQLFARREKKS